MLATLLTAESRVDQFLFELLNPDPDLGVKFHTLGFFLLEQNNNYFAAPK
jgi:hypothetical protein